MKPIPLIAQSIPVEQVAPLSAGSRYYLSEAEREVQRLKDYIYGLKLVVALMATVMAFWFTVDVLFRAVGWFRSL